MSTPRKLDFTLSKARFVATDMNRHAYVLVANNNHGKSTIQKNLVKLLCGKFYERLPSDSYLPVTRIDAPRAMKDAFIVNRSYQERLSHYKDVAGFFAHHFQEASVVVLSSHAFQGGPAISSIIRELKERFYFVTGVFLTNGDSAETRQLAQMPEWDDRILLNNPIAQSSEAIAETLATASEEFAAHIIRRFASH